MAQTIFSNLLKEIKKIFQVSMSEKYNKFVWKMWVTNGTGYNIYENNWGIKPEYGKLNRRKVI